MFRCLNTLSYQVSNQLALFWHHYVVLSVLTMETGNYDVLDGQGFVPIISSQL